MCTKINVIKISLSNITDFAGPPLDYLGKNIKDF